MQSIWISGLSLVFVMMWSSGWSASHFLTSHTGALNILSARYLIVFVILLFLVSIARQWQHVPARHIVFHLVIGALCHALYLWGSLSAFEMGVSAAAVAFINAMQPMCTALFSPLMTGERSRLKHQIGLALGLLSVVLVVSGNYQTGASLLALALPFLAMLAITAGTLLNRHYELNTARSRRKPVPLMLLLLLHTTGALLVLLPAAGIQGQMHWQFLPAEWFAIIWLAVVVTVGAYGLLLLLLRHLSTVRVASLSYLVPPATMLQGYLLFGDTVSEQDWIALALAAAAVYLIAYNNPRTGRSRTFGTITRRRLRTRIVMTGQLDIEL